MVKQLRHLIIYLLNYGYAPELYKNRLASPLDRFGMQPFAPASMNKDDAPSCRVMWADERLLSTLNISLKEGRNFFNQYPDIKRSEFILNEAAVKAYHLTNATGKQFVLDNRDTGEVVGVIKDFNFASLHSAVEPLVIQYNPFQANYLLVKVQPNQMQQTLQFLESDIRSLSPESTFTYTFMDEKMERLYEAENQLSRVFKAFAVLSSSFPASACLASLPTAHNYAHAKWAFAKCLALLCRMWRFCC